jgi:hypothetical protein
MAENKRVLGDDLKKRVAPYVGGEDYAEFIHWKVDGDDNNKKGVYKRQFST